MSVKTILRAARRAVAVLSMCLLAVPAVQAAAFTDDFSSPFTDGTSVTRMLGGTTFVFAISGGQPDRYLAPDAGEMVIYSGGVAPDAAIEVLSITRSDGADFVFTGLRLNVAPDAAMANVQGYRGGAPVGTAQQLSPGQVATLSFGGLVVDEVRVSSVDFWFTAIDNFSGDTTVPAPAVTALSPTTGPAAGGTTVVLTGSNFTGATAVAFGATAATGYTVNSATQITATAPAGTGTVNVRVTNAYGSSVTDTANQYTYLASPTVTAVSPTAGPIGGGTTVVITGTNLSGATAVRFGATNATSYTVNSATQITATAPAGSFGTVDVTVTTAGGTSATSTADQFTYVPAPAVTALSPSSGPAGGGTTVVVTGLNFTGATAVTFGGTAATGYTVDSATQITATAPAGMGTVNVRVTTAGGTSNTGAANQYTYLPAPAVTSISPTSGTAGTGVTVTGTNFTGASAVKFGATAASFILVNATTITATAPAGTGTVDVTVTTAGGTSAPSAADQFTYLTPPTSGPVNLTVAHGSTNNPVTLNLGGGAATSVAIGAAAAHGTAVAVGTSIVYTPAAGYAGPDSFTYTATNASGTSAPATVTVTVSPPTITYTPASPATAIVGVAYNLSLAGASGGAAPYTYAIASGALPAGMTLAADGTLGGTPTANGIYAFQVTATDSSTGTGPFTATSQVLTLTVSVPTISVSPASLPGPTAGVAYSQALTAVGGAAPYAYAVTAGTLPAGLSLSPGGVLSGTPTAAGTFNITVTATDDNDFTGSRLYTLSVAAPTITLAPASVGDGRIGTPYSQMVSASGGTPAYSYAVTTGSLPAGLSLDSSGVLSGTPTATGNFNFTITVTDSSTGAGPFTGSRSYSLTILNPALTMAPAALTGLAVGSAYSTNIVAGGGTGPYNYFLYGGTVLPAGMNLSADGTLSGTPTAAGSYSFTIAATDSSTGTGAPFTVARAYNVTVGAPTLALAPATLPAAMASAAYSQTLSASGGTAPYSYAVTAGTLPAGVTLSAGGALSGVPTATGTFNLTVTVTDSSSGTGPFIASQGYTLQVGAPALNVGAVNATVGYGAAATAVALDITGTPTSVAMASAPAHGTVAVSGTTLSYTPATGYAGPDSFTYTASDAYSTSAPATVSITVSAPAVAITTAALADATAGSAYAQTLAASGGAAPYRYAVTTGALPAGVTLAAGGELSGAPTEAGTFTVTVTATDSSTGTGPFTATRSYTLQVDAPAIAVAPGTLPDAMGASDYRQAFTASGGVAPYRFTVSGGDLPAGLALAESGELAGTPTTAGRHAFTVQATDANGFTGSQAYAVTVEAAAQAIEDFLATPVEPVYRPGGSFSVSARGGASGNPVVFAGTTPAVCSVQGTTVTMLAAGVCSLTADQAGNAVYQAAPQVRLDVAIAAATPVLSWLANLGKVFGEDDFDLPDPQSTSAGAFTFTSSDAAVATVSGRTVHLVGEGTAVLVATQAASGSYTTASVQVQLVVSARPDPTADAQVTGGLQAQVDAAVRFAQAQQANIRDRLRQVRNGHNRSSSNLTLAYAGSGQTPGLSVPVGQAAAGTIPALPQGWGVWLAGTATFGKSGRNGSAGGAFDFDTGGITLGADRTLGEHALLGMAASWGRQGTDFDGTPSKVDADQRSLAVYGLWRAGEHLFLDGMLATGQLDYELARWSEVAGATAHARRDGDQWFGSLTFGYEHRNASGMSLTGYGRYDGHRSELDAYAESGLGLYDLAYGRQRVDNSALAVGLEGDHPFKGGSASWRPFWTVEYRVALENQGDVAINYVQRPLGNDYALAMRSYNDDALALGAGMDLQLDSGWMFSLLLGHEQGRNSLRSNSIGLRVSYGSQPGVAPVYVDEPGLGYQDGGRGRCRGENARCDARGTGH